MCTDVYISPLANKSMKRFNIIIFYLFFAVLFSCSNTESVNQQNNDIVDLKDSINNYIPKVIDTVLQGEIVEITPVLFDSFIQGKDTYKLYGNYAVLTQNKFDFNKTFKSLLVVKNNKAIRNYYEIDISKQFFKETPSGFRKGSDIELIRIENLDKQTYSIVFSNHIGSPIFHKYSFIEFSSNNIAISDTIYEMNSIWFNDKIIQATNESFDIYIFNHLFHTKIPIKLKKENNTIINPIIDTSRLIINENFVEYSIRMNAVKSQTDFKSLDTINLLMNYNTNEIEKIPIISINAHSFEKAVRYYDVLDWGDFYSFALKTTKGFELTRDDYNNGVSDFDTKWYLRIDDGKIKGWINKKSDFDKMGLYLAG